MFGVFEISSTGQLTWLATLDDEQSARDMADETMLKLEDSVVVIPLISFRQNLG